MNERFVHKDGVEGLREAVRVAIRDYRAISGRAMNTDDFADAIIPVVQAMLAAAPGAPLASHTGEAEPFSKAAIDYNTLTLEFAGKWRGGEKVEAGEVLDWLMTLPRVAAATPAAPGEVMVVAWQCQSPVAGLGYSYTDIPEQRAELERNGWTCHELSRTAALSHPAPVQQATLQEAARETIKWLNSYFRFHDGNKFADKLSAALKGEQPVEPPSEKQQKLLDLADRIDHEELWRRAGLFRKNMTPEQCDRLDAGVALRRYANLWAPGRWVVFPPVGPVHFSASTLEKAVEMATKRN